MSPNFRSDELVPYFSSVLEKDGLQVLIYMQKKKKKEIPLVVM